MQDAATGLPEWLIDKIRSRRAVVMAGSGVSAGPPSSLPGWYRLNQMIVTALGERLDRYLERANYTGSIRAAIDARRSQNAFPPDYQAQIVEEHSGDDYFRALQCVDGTIRNNVHDGIANLARYGALAAIVTTNFDQLIEQALTACGVRFKVAYEPKTYARALQWAGDPADEPLPVLKVHGSVHDYRSMVDTLKQRRRSRNRKLEQILGHLLANHPWIFIGFSADDLETNDDYLGIIPAARVSPGVAYVQWPGEPDLRAGAVKLLAAYGNNAAHIFADSEPFLGALSNALGVPEMAAALGTVASDTREKVEAQLRDWAEALHPAAAVNCLAILAEAAGLAEEAFQLLHRFWKDVHPADREGPDFDRYRFHHGRLGVGNGIVSVVDELGTDRGRESLQNLFRIRDSEPRASAWAGTAWVRAGRLDRAAPLLHDAQRALHASVAAETIADAWLAVAEALFCLTQPEGIFETWKATANRARRAGDRPRQAEVIAVTALFHAEFAPHLYPDFMTQQAEPVLAHAKRLNAPAIDGFVALAHGRYLTKTFAGVAAQEPLQRALQHLRGAGRPPWLIYAMIESAKALLDEQSWEKAEEAAKLLTDLDPLVDRHQVWLPWFYEARGQGYLCVRKASEAVSEFELAVNYAEKFGLTRKAESLRAYFAQIGEMPATERERDD